MTPRLALAALPLLCAFVLAGCASKEDRVRSGLLEMGLSPRAAACLATPLARDLSVGELRRVAGLARAARADGWRTIHVEELLARLDVLEDGHVLAVASRAALGCALSF